MIEQPDYRFKVLPYENTDGDTFDAVVKMADFGFRFFVGADLRFRLAKIDTWEKRAVRGDQEHKAKGLAAKARTAELILGKWLWLTSEKDTEKYGRWLAVVELDKKTCAELGAEEDQIFHLYEILKREGHEKI